jgi:hypothetical protein
LGIAGGVREEWAAYDLETPDGARFEVKSAQGGVEAVQIERHRVEVGILVGHDSASRLPVLFDRRPSALDLCDLKLDAPGQQPVACNHRQARASPAGASLDT